MQTETISNLISLFVIINKIKVFLYPGSSALGLMESFNTYKIKSTTLKNEQGLGFAAGGYTLQSKKPSLCIVPLGPAATNLITTLSAQFLDNIPVVYISADTNSQTMNKDSFQEVKILDIVKPVVKKTYFIDESTSIIKTLLDAFKTSWEYPCGPTFINIPSDILYKLQQYNELQEIKYTKTKKYIHNNQKAIQLIEKSNNPVILIGKGAENDSSLIQQFSKKYQIPIVHTAGGTGIIPTDFELNYGLLRHNGLVSAASVVCNSDLILVLGSKLDYSTVCLNSLSNKKIIQIDFTRSKNINIDVHIKTSINNFLSNIVLTKVYEKPIKLKEPLKQNTKYLHPIDLIRKIEELNPKTLVLGSGEHKYWMLRHFNFKKTKLITSHNYGSMGLSLPTAIGASLACDDVVCVCGDGDLQMCLNELLSINDNNIKTLKIFVFNNSGLGATRSNQKRTTGNIYQTHDELRKNFKKIASGMDIKSEIIKSTSDLNKINDHVLYDCWIDENAELKPWVNPTKQSLQDFVNLR